MAKPLYLALERLTLDRSLQRREVESKETISRYAEIYSDYGEEAPFPPIVAFAENPKTALETPDEKIWIADGFHRVKAAKKANIVRIKLDLRKGGKREALLYALGANGEHGLHLSLDERRANAQAMLADEEWRTWSNVEISAHVHLAPNTIEKLRKTVEGAQVDERKGKDGVVRKKAAKKGKPTPEATGEITQQKSPATPTGPIIGTDEPGDPVEMVPDGTGQAHGAIDNTPKERAGYIREQVDADLPHLLLAKIYAPTELIARLVLALYHADSINKPQTVPEIARNSGLTIEIVNRSISTFPDAICAAPGSSSGDLWCLCEKADAEIDAALQKVEAEPEELTSSQPAKPEPLVHPKHQLQPLGDRRARWIQKRLAAALREGHRLARSAQELLALALLVGIETRPDDTWSESFVQTSEALLINRAALAVADRYEIGDTRGLPDWRLVAQLFGHDAESISVLAVRAIPE
jgi:hypothetical protein